MASSKPRVFLFDTSNTRDTTNSIKMSSIDTCNSDAPERLLRLFHRPDGKCSRDREPSLRSRVSHGFQGLEIDDEESARQLRGNTRHLDHVAIDLQQVCRLATPICQLCHDASACDVRARRYRRIARKIGAGDCIIRSHECNDGAHVSVRGTVYRYRAVDCC